jgi:hypothetical protein
LPGELSFRFDRLSSSGFSTGDDNRSFLEMKRTITEIFVEVEETVAVRVTEKTSNVENKTDQLMDNHTACPFCGQPVPATKNLQSKNED